MGCVVRVSQPIKLETKSTLIKQLRLIDDFHPIVSYEPFFLNQYTLSHKWLHPLTKNIFISEYGILEQRHISDFHAEGGELPISFWPW
jgi:hypothetical protein